MTMRERIARALFPNMLLTGRRMEEAMEAVDRVFDVLRVPTADMIEAGVCAPLLGGDFNLEEQAWSVWKAMINAAKNGA